MWKVSIFCGKKKRFSLLFFLVEKKKLINEVFFAFSTV